MKEFLYNLFFVLVPIFTIVLPILLSLVLYRKMKRKGIKRAWLVLAFIPIFLAVFLLLIPIKL